MFPEVSGTLLGVTAVRAGVITDKRDKECDENIYRYYGVEKLICKHVFLRSLEALFDIRDKQEVHRLGDGNTFADEVVR